MVKLQQLIERIKRDGVVKPGGVLKVDSFLNHQIDPKLSYDMAKEIHRLFENEDVNKILTIEASGIGMAVLTGLVFDCPVVFAKKSKTINLSDDVYSTTVYSFTHQVSKQVLVSKRYLNPGDRVLIVDDFLANGAALEGLCDIVEQAGASAVAVHGRTRSMLYSGRADWDRIRDVCVDIPVVANGDIDSPEAALRCRAHSGAALFMVGRAAFGDPWLLGQIAAALNGAEIPEKPALPARMDLALRQIQLAVEDKGEHIACLEARKHLAWYLRGVAHSSFYKDQISRLSTLEEVYSVVKSIKRDLR